MKLLRLGVVTVFGVLLYSAWWTTSGRAQPGSLKEITKGVWFRQGEISTMGHCNNIIIEMKDYLVIVDANFPSGAKLAMADAKKVSNKPVKYVFDTHHHGDHAYGNPVWTQAGATTLAYKAVVDEMKAREPARWLDTAKTRKDVAELNLPTAEPPQQTFSESPYVLDDGTRRIEFHFFGWAHTKGDGFVYLPKERILCTGDAVANGPYNFLGDANVANWPKVIQQAQKLNVQTVLPGHGEPAGKELLTGQAQFMTELRREAEKAVKAGKPLDSLVTMENGKPTRTSVKLSANVQRWASEGLAGRLKDAYDEVKAGKPHGDL